MVLTIRFQRLCVLSVMLPGLVVVWPGCQKRNDSEIPGAPMSEGESALLEWATNASDVSADVAAANWANVRGKFSAYCKPITPDVQGQALLRLYSKFFAEGRYREAFAAFLESIDQEPLTQRQIGLSAIHLAALAQDVVWLERRLSDIADSPHDEMRTYLRANLALAGGENEVAVAICDSFREKPAEVSPSTLYLFLQVIKTEALLASKKFALAYATFENWMPHTKSLAGGQRCWSIYLLSLGADVAAKSNQLDVAEPFAEAALKIIRHDGDVSWEGRKIQLERILGGRSEPSTRPTSDSGTR